MNKPKTSKTKIRFISFRRYYGFFVCWFCFRFAFGRCIIIWKNSEVDSGDLDLFIVCLARALGLLFLFFRLWPPNTDISIYVYFSYIYFLLAARSSSNNISTFYFSVDFWSFHWRSLFGMCMCCVFFYSLKNSSISVSDVSVSFLVFSVKTWNESGVPTKIHTYIYISMKCIWWMIFFFFFSTHSLTLS